MAAAAVYFGLFFFSARQVGGNDADRYYHLAIASLEAQGGLLRTLPQVEDLGWGRYFPDKEFLFHVLTWSGQRLAGFQGVLAVVPLLAGSLLALLYAESARVLRPGLAACLVVFGVFLTAMFVFRLSLLRPHLLAIGCFCALLVAVLRGRPLWALLAAFGFALSYHAFYLVLMLAGLAALFPWPEGGRWRLPAAASIGLGLGVLLNPYFPSNLVMSWVHLQLALGLDMPPGLQRVPELEPFSAGELVRFYGIVPLALLGGAWAMLERRRPRPEPAGRADGPALPFLMALTATLAVLGLKSPRAMEYALPVAILLAAHVLAQARRMWQVPLFFASLAILQFGSAKAYYEDIWSQSQAGDSGWYLQAISALPAQAAGQKVFNCEWTAGAYLLYWRPDVRFVDLLEPSFLWRVSPRKYLIRQALVAGADPAPWLRLRRDFAADYVMCAAPGLLRQMDSDSAHFESIPTPAGPLKIYRLREAGARPAGEAPAT